MYALEEERKFLLAMHAERIPEMLYWSARSYLAAFAETKETGDSYEGFCKRWKRAKKIAPVAYSFQSLKTMVASFAYMLDLPVIYYAWRRLKKYLKSGG